jgi:PleD family two-component response regulator
MGIASARSGESYEDLARRADRALYEAKEAGRNTIRWAS